MRRKYASPRQIEYFDALLGTCSEIHTFGVGGADFCIRWIFLLFGTLHSICIYLFGVHRCASAMEPPRRVQVLDQSFFVIPEPLPTSTQPQADANAIIGSTRAAQGAAAVEQMKAPPKAVSVTQQFSDDLNSVPQRIFDEPVHQEAASSNSVRRWAASSSHTPVDGFAKGMFAFGRSVMKGVTGVFVDPIEGAKKDGGVGFFKGLGKGMAGYG